MTGSRQTLLQAFLVVLILGAGVGLAGAAENGGPETSELLVSEFVASNDRSLRDEEGDYPDWIEIQNTTGEVVNLEGWCLTDDLDDLTQWEFPAMSIAPGEHLVVFASGRNERDPEAELHTNFALAAGGESLALVRPDETIAHAYPDYPPQFADIAYGMSGASAGAQTQAVLIADGAQATAQIPTDASLGTEWTEAQFDDRDWLSGTTGIGYDYAGLIGLDVGAMRHVNQSVYVRIQFQMDNAEVDQLILRLRYEDGFVAYLNGFEVARANAPAGALTWDSGATANRPDTDAVEVQEFDLTVYRDWLIPGDNVLAIQGLNDGTTSSDLLILPELIATTFEALDLSGVVEGYLLQPTPGGANLTALAQIGPAIRDVTENPPPPIPGEDIVVTARVSETLAPVLGVGMTWVVGFDRESRLPIQGIETMTDDGTGADAVPNDGLYTATIPGAVFQPGDMVRWCVDAVDTQGQLSRAPLFPQPRNSPEYYGTVVHDPALNTALPVLHWFVENVAASEAERALGKKDPGFVAVDEVVGYFVCLFWLPRPFSWHLIAASFFLFRVFDVWKPEPMRSLERVPGGLGIMLDDVAAGAIACLILQVIYRVILPI